MLIGRQLLEDKNISLDEVSHQNIQELLQTLEDNQAQYHTNAIQSLEDALKACYGERDVSLQQLSATFRRGDLLEMLGSTQQPML